MRELSDVGDVFKMCERCGLHQKNNFLADGLDWVSVGVGVVNLVRLDENVLSPF